MKWVCPQAYLTPSPAAPSAAEIGWPVSSVYLGADRKDDYLKQLAAVNARENLFNTEKTDKKTPIKQS